MKRRPLPPLKSIVYFEAAARLQSFTKASKELNVTQGAVSRQIRQLESYLGKSLFRREKRQVLLTDNGHNYYVSIAHILQQLGNVTENLVGPDHPDQLTLVTSSALAPMYLMPRIPQFRKAHQDIQIRIVAKDDISQLAKVDFDLALYFSKTVPEGFDCVPLFAESVFPVCSPDYLRKNKDQFSSRQGLSSNLIWLESQEDWINWPEWLDAMNIKVTEFHNPLVVNSYPMVIQAAIAGQGVALAWKNLVDPEINRGSLVRPTKLTLNTESHFYLITPKPDSATENTQRLKTWLVENSC